jgi:hypothetical protein
MVRTAANDPEGVAFEYGGRMNLMLSISKPPVSLRGWLGMCQIIKTENIRNEFVSHDLLHQQSHQLRTRNTTFLRRLLQILHIQFDNDTLDRHCASPNVLFDFP